MGPEGAFRDPMITPSLIDSHCHIVFRNFDDDLDAVAERWRDAGVTALLHACVEPAEIPAIRALADRFPELRYSVGVHPLDTEHWADDTQAVLRAAALADDRVVAIGELGLDLFRDKNLSEQLATLRPQLDLAVELNLPVIVHCRDAAAPMLEELRARRARGACPAGVMHCWGGTPEEMEQFLELGFCPFLAPVPRRGKRNEPAFVAAVATRVAELREQSIEQVAMDSTTNARALFGLP